MNYPSSWLQGASLGEKIACELRLQIIKKEISPGTVLSENQIATEFGTSRSPVREGLKTLSNEGLIRLERMGIVVLGIVPKDIEELYDVRFLIESFILKRLSKGNSEGLERTLHQVIDKMEIAAKHRDFIEFAYLDITFHEVMIIESGHTRMLHLWQSIRQIVLTALLVATENRFKKEQTELEYLVDQHRLIIDALVSKDTVYIEKIIRNHFEDTRTTVNDALLKKDQ